MRGRKSRRAAAHQNFNRRRCQEARGEDVPGARRIADCCRMAVLMGGSECLGVGHIVAKARAPTLGFCGFNQVHQDTNVSHETRCWPRLMRQRSSEINHL